MHCEANYYNILQTIITYYKLLKHASNQNSQWKITPNTKKQKWKYSKQKNKLFINKQTNKQTNKLSFIKPAILTTAVIGC